jgi:nitroreductase
VDVFETIEKRRSIKPLDMKPDPVEPEIIRRLLEAANWAPSHRHTEPWRFIVFHEAARKRLADAVIATLDLAEQNDAQAPNPKIQSTYDKMLQAPVIIAIICHVSPLPKVVLHEEIASTAMAVQNMHLAARALGLGAFWTSGAKAFHTQMATFLELKPNEQCLGFLYVGWPAINWPVGRRGDVKEKVKWHCE